MLNKSDETELEHIIEDVGTGIHLNTNQINWLVTKLKETNDELKEKNQKIKSLRREINITDDEFNKLAARVEYCEKNHLN